MSRCTAAAVRRLGGDDTARSLPVRPAATSLPVLPSATPRPVPPSAPPRPVPPPQGERGRRSSDLRPADSGPRPHAVDASRVTVDMITAPRGRRPAPFSSPPPLWGRDRERGMRPLAGFGAAMSSPVRPDDLRALAAGEPLDLRAPPPRPSPSRGEGEPVAESHGTGRLLTRCSVTARRRRSDRPRLRVPSPLEGEGQGGGARRPPPSPAVDAIPRIPRAAPCDPKRTATRLDRGAAT